MEELDIQNKDVSLTDYSKTREKGIVATSFVGIGGNVLLVAIKAVVGFLAGSISLIMDALNNLTDALSSIITIIGTKLSNKKPDRKHPYGHGRIEYLTATIIGAIILFAGGMAIYESIVSIVDYFSTKIMPNYTIVALVLIGVGIVIKLGIGLFYRIQAKKLNSDFDVVLAMEESPIMLVKPAIAYAKKFKKPLIMYEMDLWPESLLAGGVGKKSFIYKHYKNVSAKIYSQFDKIIVSTKEHILYIKELSRCKDLDIEYLAQYADTIFEESEFGNEDNGVVDLMFAGNIGKAQSVDTIIRAAALLKENPGFKFHIVGSGSELDNIKKFATELITDNVVFYGHRPLEDMPELYKIADAMLVTLEDKPYANMTIPGKVQSYMAVGKPIIGAINGSCANFIKNNDVGFACPSGDSEALANLIKGLDLKELQMIGERSKDVYFKKYSKSIFMKRLISTLDSMKK